MKLTKALNILALSGISISGMMLSGAFWYTNRVHAAPPAITKAAVKMNRSAIDIASRKYGIPRHIIKAVIHVESRGNHLAVSNAGAAGIMQLMPGTAREMGVKNRFNRDQNIIGGTKYLRKMLNRFDQDLYVALAAYNGGPGNWKAGRGYARKVLDTARNIE